MLRKIIGFHQDDLKEWVADLECGHSIHMRHNPPWSIREWVLTEDGRVQFLGHKLECVKCEASEDEHLDR